MMKRFLHDDERRVLEFAALDRGGLAPSTATHWFAEHVGPAAGTADARKVLQGLSRLGLMEGVSYRGGRVYWWRITPAGRDALSVTSA